MSQHCSDGFVQVCLDMSSVSRLCPEMSRMSRNPGHIWTFVDMIGQIWTKDLGHVQDMSRDVHHVLVLWIDLDIPGRIWTSLNWTNLDKLGNIRACPVMSRFVQCGCVQFKLATAATPARRARPAQRNNKGTCTNAYHFICTSFTVAVE